MNIRSRLAALLGCGVIATTAFAQSADPAVTAVTHVPQTIAVGQTSQLLVNFSSAGFDPIPAASIKLSICGADLFYQTDGVTPPAGYGTNFAWSHPSTDCWEGINIAAIAPLAGGVITLNYTGLLVTPSPQTTSVNIEVIANLAAFILDNTGNNQLSGTLAVVSPLLTKAFGAASIAGGGVTTLTFTLAASNTAPASSISFVDTLPTGLRIASPANVGGTCSNSVAATAAPAGGGAITVTNVNVPAGPSACTVTVDVTNVAGQSNASCVATPAAFTNGPGNISGLSASAVNGVQPSCLVVTAAVPNLVLNKTANVASVAQNGNFTYSLTVNNTGAAASAANTVITDAVPVGVTINSLTNGAGWSCTPTNVIGAGNITCTKAAGVSAGVVNETVVTLNATKTSATNVTNTANVTSGDAACVVPLPSRCTASATVNDASLPNLVLGKTASVASIAQNGAYTYTLTLANSGPVASAANTVITDAVPVGVTINSLTNGAGWSCTPTNVIGAGNITCTKAAGVSAGVVNETVVTLNATKTSATNVTNTANVTSGDAGCAAPLPARCTSQAVVIDSTPVITASLSLVKSAGAATVALGANPIVSDAGDTITYTFTVSNTGNVAINSVTVVDVKLPALSCALPVSPLGAGLSAVLVCTNNVYTLTGPDIAAGLVINSATASGVPASCNPAVVPCPSTQTPQSTTTTPLVTQGAAMVPVPATSPLTLLLMGLMLLAGAGLALRTRR